MREKELIKKVIAFELKTTPIWKYAVTLLAVILLGYFGSDFVNSDILEGNSSRLAVGADVFFLVVLAVPISILRFKPFMIQDLKGGLYASPFFIMLKQMPLSKKVIRKSRFIVTGIYTVALNSLAFIIFYFMSAAVSERISFLGALALWLCWISVSYIWGALLAAADPGAVYTTATLVIWSIVYIVIAFWIFVAVNILLGNAFVVWTLETAVSNPLLLIFVAIGIAIISTLIWVTYYKYYEKKVDYHV